VNWREAARCGEWAQHFSNASCFHKYSLWDDTTAPSGLYAGLCHAFRVQYAMIQNYAADPTAAVDYYFGGGAYGVMACCTWRGLCGRCLRGWWRRGCCSWQQPLKRSQQSSRRRVAVTPVGRREREFPSSTAAMSDHEVESMVVLPLPPRYRLKDLLLGEQHSEDDRSVSSLTTRHDTMIRYSAQRKAWRGETIPPPLPTTVRPLGSLSVAQPSSECF